ncbi:MAG: hypothetical protein QOE92_9 [Chloroflexota bacterium]|jgi:hypothetical protein|nr:hypothetical protein [Chloroflexota bacterium]
MAEARRATLARSTIEGNWIRLTPLDAYPPDALDDLRFRLGLRPEMVAPGAHGAIVGSRFGEPAIIADAGSGEMLGVISNVEIGEYPGVAGLVIYVDESRSRAGHAMEAYWRYVKRIFDLGATKVQMEVMSFNTPVHRIMRKIGARPEAVLREHFFIAGRHWDGTLYGVDRKTWAKIDDRYRDVVARPVALASSRQDTEVIRPPREEAAMKVDYLILADAAIAADGKHYLHGAGWDTVAARSFPVWHPQMSAAVRLRVPAGDAPHRLGVDLLDPTGASLLPAPLYTDVNPAAAAGAGAEEQVFALVFNFGGLQFSEPGAYAVVLTADAVELVRSTFHVRRAG